MAIYTREQIIEKIQNIDIQIESAQSVSEYDLDTGQGTQRVRRQAIKSLLDLRDYWERKLDALDNASSGLQYGEFYR